MVQDTPKLRVMFADKTGKGVHGHGFSQDHNQGLKQQREPASGTGLGKIHQPDTTFAATDSRNSGCQVGFKLEKVQMPSCLLFGIIRCPLFRTLPTQNNKKPFYTLSFTQSSSFHALSILILLRNKFLSTNGRWF